MILVTGAAGKTGRAVIQALVKRGEAVRALVRRSVQVGQLLDLGAQEVIVGDMGVLPDVTRAMEGIRTVYHICPNINPNEVRLADVAMAAALAAKVQHFVYHSVLHPQTQDMPHHWHKLQVEEDLFQSGLTYTILQPASYMQNILAGWNSIVTDGLYRVPYAPQTQLGMVDLADVAEAAAVVMTEIGHDGAIYELAGPEVLSQQDVAEILSRHLNRPVRVEAIPQVEWEQQAHRLGRDDYEIQTLLKMFRYYEQHGFFGNPNVLARLIGRSPTTFTEFVARTLQTQVA